jgi:uncharacterized protein with HEPN domain
MLMVRDVVSNDEYKSVDHSVVQKSIQEAMVSIAVFSNPDKCGDSSGAGNTRKASTRYRSLTWSELLRYRKQLVHARPSLDKFKVNLH